MAVSYPTSCRLWQREETVHRRSDESNTRPRNTVPMPVIYDLHCHSTASDGTLSPGALVAHACAQGVNVLALTDHDVTAGIAEARQAAAGTGLTLGAGVEISVTWNHQLLHFVGLGVEGDAPALAQGLEPLRAFRVWRAEEITRRLEKRGIGGAYEGARALAQGPEISRTHIARYLVSQGHARTVQQAFDRYLKRGKAGYVPGEWATLKEFKDGGGEAREGVSGRQPHGATPTLARYTQQFELLASGGADYHGPGQGTNELGRIPALPAPCVPVWQTWSNTN